MGTRSYEFGKRLVAEGHEVTILCGNYHLADVPAEVDGMRVVQIPVSSSNRDGFLKRIWAFAHFAILSAWHAIRIDCDLVYATSTPLTIGIPALAAKYLRGRRMIFEVRDLWPELPRAMGIIRNPLALALLDRFEQSCYRGADACVGLAPGIVEGIQKKAPGKRVELIPNGCDLEVFGKRRALACEMPQGRVENPVGARHSASGSPTGGNVLTALFCGAHGRANGLDAVLDAAAELKRRDCDEVQVLFVGDGQLKAALKDRAVEEGLDNCVFLDPMPKAELAELMRSCDVGLMILADVEAFQYGTSPNKFFDYIAAGLPVVCNYPGWVSEMLVEHQCGHAVPPGNPNAFADVLENLATNRSELEPMGFRSRELAEQSFHRDALFQRLNALIEEVAGTRRR